MSVTPASTEPVIDYGALHARRGQLSKQYLRGKGIEIGALHQPLVVSRRARVTYVDRMSVDDLRRQYPELETAGYKLSRVDRIDDGEKLETFPPKSLDFIIANHMLEHCENPIGTIRSHLSKVRGRSLLSLRPGGVLYYAIPDKRISFDATRELTTWDHFLADERNGPEHTRWQHFMEYAQHVEKALPGDVEGRAHWLQERNYSIHFHVWDFDSFRSFLENTRAYLGNAFDIVEFEQNQLEIVAILRRN